MSSRPLQNTSRDAICVAVSSGFLHGTNQTGNAKANRPNESGKIGKRRHRFVKVGTASRIGILGARRYVRTVNFFRPREVVVGIVPQVRENKRVKVCDVSKMSPTGG